MMHRIDTPNARADENGPGKTGFSYNTDIPGQDPTYFDPDWCNAVQEEIAGVAEDAGLALDKGNNSQLLAAIKVLAGKSVATVTTSGVLSTSKRGLVLIDASANDVVLTLPPASSLMDFTLARVDASAHKVQVSAAGTETILHNLHVRPTGYSFIRLFGAGDFWSLRSTSAGSWLPTERRDMLPIGSLQYTTGNLTPPGGFIYNPAGTFLLRSDYPWLWDYAGACGNLVSDAAWTAGRQGSYSTGDGATSFRVLDLRGDFIRVFDDGRAVDTGRVVGSNQSWAIENITGTFAFSAANGGTGGDGAFAGDGKAAGRAGSSTPFTEPSLTFDASRVVKTATETRPRNIALPTLLKAI